MKDISSSQHQADDSYLNNCGFNMSNNKQIVQVQNLLTKMQPQLIKALPKHLSAERMSRIALTELRKTPKLLQCDPVSFVGAVMICAQIGLEPGGALGHIYLVPYGNQVQVVVGYRGMIQLARHSGQIVSLSAHEVYENDKFEFEYGLDEKLKHVPFLGDRGKLIAVYALAHLVGGGHQIEVMSKSDVDKIKKLSKTSGKGPWVDHYEEMAKKTVLRKLFKYLPVSIEIQRATAIDEQADYGLEQTGLDEIGEEFNVDPETGEILDSVNTKDQADSLAEKL